MSSLSSNSLLRLPYSDDLTLAGITYALRSLAYTYDRMGGSSFKRLRRIVAGKAVELAFRRYLDENKVPYNILGTTPFTDPDRYDVALGGHRCDLKSFLICHRKMIRQIRRQPELLLDAAALVPSDQLESEHLRADDLYIFAFVTALMAAHSTETQRAFEAGQPIYLVHPMPERWARPKDWTSLGKIVFKSESAPILTLELGGQTSTREFCTQTVKLFPGKRFTLDEKFFTLAYLHLHEFPLGRVGVYSSMLEETYLVEPYEWANIWVYGMDVFLAGYISHAEFRQYSELLPKGSRVWQYSATLTTNNCISVHNLHCLTSLLEQVIAWKKKNAINCE